MKREDVPRHAVPAARSAFVSPREISTSRSERAGDRAGFVADDRTGLRTWLEAATGDRLASLDAAGEDRAKGREARAGPDRGVELERGRSASRVPERSPGPRRADREPDL